MQNRRLRLNTVIWIALICATIIIFILSTSFKQSLSDDTVSDVSTAQELSLPEEISTASESYEPDIPDESDEPIEISYIDTEANGFALYINGEFVAACRAHETIDDALATLLANRTALYDVGIIEDAHIANDVEIKAGHYPDDCIADYDTLLGLLGVSHSGVLAGDLTDVYGCALDSEIKIATVSTASVTETIAYGTQRVFTDAMIDGETSVISAGVSGVQDATYRYTAIDGEVVQSDLLSATVVSPAVDQVLSVGVRSTAMATASYNGFFDYPTKYATYITSSYGMRELMGSQDVHRGIDLARYGASCYGEDVYSCADGVVIFAGTKGDYGRLVIVRHTDSITTYYAHLSAISVEVGDVVSQGQKIGEIGSTGLSTGPHLHLEIRIDDTPVNPLKFLDY